MVNTEIKLILFFAVEDGEAVYSQQKQYLELIMAQIINFLQQNSGLSQRKWENHQASRYDLNQIPYNYAVEVMNRFKGLDLVNHMPELWTEVCNTVQEQ